MASLTAHNLDSSSRNLDSMRSLILFRTPNLVELNLSCNSIREIEGLESLVNLHRLILSFNKITSLQGIADAASSKLYYIDLKGNLINDFAQLEYLAVIPSLKELVLKSSDPASTIINPICKHPQYSQRVLQILPFISHLDNPTIQSFPDLEAEFEFSDPIIEHKVPQDASIDNRLFHRLERIEETMHSLAHNQQPSHPQQHSPQYNKTTEPANTTNAQMIQYFQAVLDKLDQTRNEVHRRDHLTSVEAESDVTAAARERILSLEAKVASLGKSLNERVHADALRSEALGMMAQAAPSDDESTDGGATIPIKIPTRIPKPSEPGRKLVWKQQNPSVKAEPIQLDQTKPSSHTSGSTNPQTAQPATSDNMAALLKSLETEKQKYSDNERRYAAEIVALNEKLALAEVNASEEKKTRMHVQESIKALQESTALRAENHALVLKEVNQSLEKETAAKQSAEQAAKLLEQKLEESQTQVTKTLLELTSLQASFQEAERDKEVLAKQILQDREERKAFENEMGQELDAYRRSIRKLSKSKLQLESAIQAMQTDRLDFEKRSTEAQSTAISEAVSKTRNELDARHREEKERLEKQVLQKSEEIRVKEDEFQNSIKKEHKKYTELYKAFQEIAEESNQMSKALEESAKSEHDLRTVARELTHLVKDQKLKIAELMRKNEASFVVFEEKCNSMETQLKTLENAKLDLERMKRELDACKETLSERQSRIEALEAEKQIISRSVIEQVSNLNHEIQALHAKVKQLEAGLLEKQAAREEAEQALRIKVKMLDDQNDTIRTLKQNLDNKTRDHSAVLQDINTRESKLEDSLSKEKKKVRELTNELISQNEAFESLQSAFEDCKSERDALHSEVLKVSEKLQERNTSIAHIELEVSRVKSVFAAKEAKLVQERDDLLRTREISVDEVKRHYEAQMSS
ncbi:hypothetical protein CcCBS67573_g05185 [Chytriomyces confervae]|uniref:U2A'/phosphoprotein 32 family A C-terminal domain-containing protein n=1 Tax=Chytriomyces confervae TaxID=246404 RepID=A0A507FCR6_9FUNG|nr:hypothetical protein CcCBS67573_g05185 [Chytriomyces confervae]